MRFIPSLAALLAVSLLCGCTHQNDDQAFSGRRVPPAVVRIASWDMRFLGPSNHTRDEHRSPDDIAAYIAQSGAAAIALQSVGQTPGADRRNATLDQALSILRQQGQGDWDYLLFPTQSQAHDQLTGVAWNKSILDKSGEYALSVPTAEVSPADDALLFDRPPHAVKFTTGSGHVDFVIVSIHLQSNLGPGDHIAHRVTEVRALAGQLGTIRERLNDRDILLAGNFGIANSAETTERLLTQAGYRDLNAADYPTTLDGASDDRIFVPAEDANFAKLHTVNLVRMNGLSGEAFRRRLSDHYMIYIDLKTGDGRD
jgi:hypothetical protein